MSLAVVAGTLSGAGNVLFIAVVNSALHPRAGAAAARAGFVIGLCCVVVLARFLSDAILIRLSERVVFELRVRLSRAILLVPLRRIEVLGGHSLFATLTEDVGRLAELALNIPNVCVNGAIVITGMGYLFYLSPRVMLAVAATISLGVVVYSFIRIRAVKHFQRARERQGELMKHFRALTDGMKEMKLNRTRKAAFVSRLENTAHSLRHELVTGNTTFGLALSWAQFTFFILIAMFVLRASAGGNYGLGPAILSGTVLALLCIRIPMETVVGMFLGLARAQVALSKIDQLGISLAAETEPSTLNGEEKEDDRPPVQAIEMEGIIHSYHSETDSFSLGPLDLSFRPGEVVFVSGGNGSGKTTFIKLLCGLYVPESGELRYNGVPVTNANREDYRSRFAAVFSDFFLSDTIARPPSLELDALAASYLQEFRLGHKVQVKNGVFSTIDLSQGQRKRLALIAACLEDKPIYVFDEWAADQDASFRQKFYYEIIPELKRKGKTLFVISHDQQYFSQADRLIVLEEGRLWKDTSDAEQLRHVISQMLTRPAVAGTHARTAP
jgi:putative pyoverdin transport system ATP-binding/permease protein